MDQISQDLSREGIKTLTGKDNWNKTTVDRILRSVIYRGDYLFQQYLAVNTAEKQLIRNKGEAPQYYIEEHHEAIITPKEWEDVQEIINERVRVSTKKNDHIKTLWNKKMRS